MAEEIEKLISMMVLINRLIDEMMECVKSTESGWDPLHRLINDMKHGMVFGPKKTIHRLQTALVASTYLFNLNYKPFKGGSFHADKKELLEHFLSTMTEDRWKHDDQVAH